MKNKKLLAILLLPLSLSQTISAWFASEDNQELIFKILNYEKTLESRRSSLRENNY